MSCIRTVASLIIIVSLVGISLGFHMTWSQANMDRISHDLSATAQLFGRTICYNHTVCFYETWDMDDPIVCQAVVATYVTGYVSTITGLILIYLSDYLCCCSYRQ